MLEANNMIGKKEEITDILTVEGILSGDFKKGQMLKFNYEGSLTCIKITKLDKKNGRAWGEHISPIAQNVALSHYGHAIDVTKETMEEFGNAYCQDCEVVVSEQATLAGKTKAQHRADRQLEDGTEI